MIRLFAGIPAELTRKADHDAMFMLVVSILILLGSAGFFLILILLRILYQAKTAACSGLPPDAVYLVFGKALIADQPDREYLARLDRLIECGCQSAILMGGRTPGNTVSEALAGLRYLESRGIETRSIRLEQDSRSTLENLRNSRELIQNQPAVIISNRYHLYRCSILAKNLSIQHDLCAAENNLPLNTGTLFKCLIEAFYIHWFYSGNYWARLTRNKRMLSKIT